MQDKGKMKYSGAKSQKPEVSGPMTAFRRPPSGLHRVLSLACLTLLLAGGNGRAAAAATNTPAPKKAEKAGPPAGKAAAGGTNTNATAVVVELPLPKSTFTVALNGTGRDPFYPKTTRFGPQTVGPTTTNKTVVVAEPEVKINGFSGVEGQPLVIVNNVTFGVGDDRQVLAGTARLQVRCLEIRPDEQMAILEVNGKRRELRFLKKN